MGRLRGVLRTKVLLCVLVFLLSSTSFAAAQYSDISYLDVTISPDARESRTVDVNPNGSFIASGYEGMVAVHGTENLERIASFPVDHDVLDVQFSPDGRFLAFAMSGSNLDTDLIQIIDVDTMTLTSKQSGANSQSLSIQWSPDGHLLAVPNSNNGIDLLRTSDMEVERTLNGQHNSRITSIDFSSLGSYVLTGDEGGRVVMWTADGNPTGKQWNHDSKIVSTEFDSNDEHLAVLTEQGQLAIWSFEGGAIIERQFDGASTLHWSNDDRQIHLLETGSSTRIVTLDTSTLGDIVSTYMAHQGLDFDITENEFGTRQMAYVASDSAHIVAYGAVAPTEGKGELGADLDGDEIPDEYDDDDDGDAIPDQRDNNCETFTQACSKNPDVNTIRKVEVWFESQSMILEDTITLDIELSSALRNLSRRSLVADAQLTEAEAEHFAIVACQNMNLNHYIGSWKDAIELSSGQLTDGTVACSVDRGMAYIAQNDQKTHVAITYSVHFNLSEVVDYPLQFTLTSQPTATDASLLHLAELHPIDVTVDGSTTDQFYYSPWWKSEGQLDITLQQSVVKEPDITAKIVQAFDDYPLLILPVLIAFFVGAIAVLRTKNSFDLELNLDEDEEEDSGDSSMNEVKLDGEEFDAEEPIEEASTLSANLEGQDSNESKELNTSPVRSRRKAVSRAVAAEGPITTVKRKRLDSGIKPIDERPKKKKAARKKITKGASPKPVKTRRVVTHSDKVSDED